MIQYKHIVSKCFSFRIDYWLITDNVHSNAVYNHNHRAIGIVRSNDYQDVFFLTWKFHYSSAIRSAVTKTFTESRMELEINSSPSKHAYPNSAKAWATLLHSIHLNKQTKKEKFTEARDFSSCTSPPLGFAQNASAANSCWSVSALVSRVSLLTPKFSAAWTPCRVIITSAWKALSKWLA